MQCENLACPWWADSPPEAARFDQSLMAWPPPPLDPSPEFREPCWRFVGPSNRILRCEIVAVATEWEVQARYEGDADPIRTQLVVSIGAGRIVAVRWREAVEARASLVPLDAADGRSWRESGRRVAASRRNEKRPVRSTRATGAVAQRPRGSAVEMRFRFVHPALYDDGLLVGPTAQP